MILDKTSLEGCYIIQPRVFEDKRGYFFESYNHNKFNQLLGYEINFVQDNESKSQKGVLRGLHFQVPPYAQAKLVRVVQGEVLDIAVDLRKDSPTYGKHESVLLTAKNKKQFFMPRGFAHGFLVLSETAIFSYKIDNIYAPDYDTGIIWNDKDLNIDWKFDDDKLILSEKDKNLQSFKGFKSPF